LGANNTPEPLPVGTLVMIRNSGYGERRMPIVEYRGPLGPMGARVYRIMVRRKPSSTWIEVLEEHLEVVKGE
jgi:hypothetical protein